MEIGTMVSDKMESNLAENRVDQGYTIYGMDVDSPLKVDVTKGKYGEKVATSLRNGFGGHAVSRRRIQHTDAI